MNAYSISVEDTGRSVALRSLRFFCCKYCYLFPSSLKQASSKREEIINEYRPYRRQQRAKIVIPVIVAILAYSLSNESGSERVIDGLAGYGGTAALEATGIASASRLAGLPSR